MKDFLFDEIFEEMRSTLKEFFSYKDVETIRPPANIKETENKFIVEILLPGVKKEDVKIKIDEDNIMVVEGESHLEEEEIVCYHRLEWSLKKFRIKFELSKELDLSQIASILKDGILKIIIPKKEKKIIELKIE
jgi:HSP20 family protein